MRIKDLVELHKQVIHITPQAHTCTTDRFDPKCNLCIEERWVKRYPYDSLESVCSDCFGNPNRFIAEDERVCLAAEESNKQNSVVI